jgi:hypothetical protein
MNKLIFDYFEFNFCYLLFFRLPSVLMTLLVAELFAAKSIKTFYKLTPSVIGGHKMQPGYNFKLFNSVSTFIKP